MFYVLLIELIFVWHTHLGQYNFQICIEFTSSYQLALPTAPHLRPYHISPFGFRCF